MNYTIYFILAKILFYLLWTILFLYKKKPRLHVAPLNRKGFIFPGILIFQYNAINNPSPPKNSTQPQ